MASGLHGEGRMAEPEEIISFLEKEFFQKKEFSKKKVLITAGPTYEAIDPVRFVGNRSTGKMGFAVARAAARRGARVILVAGPTALPTPAGVERVDVESAAQMHEAVMARADGQTVIVMSAAV